MSNGAGLLLHRATQADRKYLYTFQLIQQNLQMPQASQYSASLYERMPMFHHALSTSQPTSKSLTALLHQVTHVACLIMPQAPSSPI
jgi:hypothetical protein